MPIGIVIRRRLCVAFLEAFRNLPFPRFIIPTSAALKNENGGSINKRESEWSNVTSSVSSHSSHGREGAEKSWVAVRLRESGYNLHLVRHIYFSILLCLM